MTRSFMAMDPRPWGPGQRPPSVGRLVRSASLERHRQLEACAVTEAERRALTYMATYSGDHTWLTPAQIGQGMGGTKSGKAQGLGRIGGRMAARLRKMGFVADRSMLRRGFPAYCITQAGRLALNPPPENTSPPRIFPLDTPAEPE